MINQVLDLSKIEAGRMSLEEKNFDLHRFLDTLNDLFGIRAEEKSLQLSVDWAPDVPRYVRMDEVKLRQILINLLNNAIKFTKEGGVELEVTKVTRVTKVKKEDLPSPVTHLTFKISDTGVGVAPEEMDRLFQAFSQTQSGRMTREGTGLGLAISQKFVSVMGGRIGVSSDVGKGSTFLVTLPTHLVQAGDVSHGPDVRQVIGLAPDLPRYRLLIVDDVPESRRLLKGILAPLRLDIQEAGHGREAVEIWQQWQPHMIFMDMRMPVMNGYDATKLIREAEGSRHSAEGSRHSAGSRRQEAGGRQAADTTRIIAITASTFNEESSTALSAGCDDFLSKPIQEQEIFDILQKHLGLRYLYADPIPHDGMRNREQGKAATPLSESLKTLAPELLTSLREATRYCDSELIEGEIAKIRLHNAEAAAGLMRLANKFKYEKMLKLLQEAGVK